MKRIIPILTVLYLFCFLIIPPVQAQEKEIEKKIRIVTVDENGKKVVIDTVLTGDIDLEDLDLPEGIIIQKKGDHSIIVSDEDTKSIYVTIDKEGDISADKDIHNVVIYTIAEGDTIKKEARAYAGKHENIAWVSTGDSEDIQIIEGQLFIRKGDKDSKAIIISVDESGKEKVKSIGISKGHLDEGEKEIIIRSAEGEEIFKIKGDVVIRIEGDKIKVEKEEKIVKEKKEVKK